MSRPAAREMTASWWHLGGRNPMNRALVIVVAFEVIVFGLGFPGMVIVSSVSKGLAGLAAGGSALLALLAAAMMRRPIGWAFAWAAQVAGLAMGFLTPMMFVAAGVFVLIFVTSFVLGRRIESRPQAQSPNGPAA